MVTTKLLPTITSFVKSKFAISGGSNLEIKGENLLSYHLYGAFFTADQTTERSKRSTSEELYGYANLSISSDILIVIIIPRLKEKYRQDVNYSIELDYDGLRLSPDKPLFITYIDDPRILDLQPRKPIITGGVNFEITGANLDGVSPILNYDLQARDFLDRSVYNGSIKQDCVVINSTLFKCLFEGFTDFPAIYKEDNMTKLSITVGFTMANFPLYRDLKKSEPALYKTIGLELAKAEYEKFNEIEHLFFPNESVKIRGEKLDYGLRASDYMILVGDMECDIISLQSSQIDCMPPQSKPPPSLQNGICFKVNTYPVKLLLREKKSNVLATAFCLKYETNLRQLIVILSIVFGICLIIFLVVLICFICKDTNKLIKTSSSIKIKYFGKKKNLKYHEYLRRISSSLSSAEHYLRPDKKELMKPALSADVIISKNIHSLKQDKKPTRQLKRYNIDSDINIENASSTYMDDNINSIIISPEVYDWVLRTNNRNTICSITIPPEDYDSVFSTYKKNSFSSIFIPPEDYYSVLSTSQQDISSVIRPSVDCESALSPNKRKNSLSSIFPSTNLNFKNKIFDTVPLIHKTRAKNLKNINQTKKQQQTNHCSSLPNCRINIENSHISINQNKCYNPVILSLGDKESVDDLKNASMQNKEIHSNVFNKNNKPISKIRIEMSKKNKNNFASSSTKDKKSSFDKKQSVNNENSKLFDNKYSLNKNIVKKADVHASCSHISIPKEDYDNTLFGFQMPTEILTKDSENKLFNPQIPAEDYDISLQTNNPENISFRSNLSANKYYHVGKVDTSWKFNRVEMRKNLNGKNINRYSLTKPMHYIESNASRKKNADQKYILQNKIKTNAISPINLKSNLASFNADMQRQNFITNESKMNKETSLNFNSSLINYSFTKNCKKRLSLTRPNRNFQYVDPVKDKSGFSKRSCKQLFNFKSLRNNTNKNFLFKKHAHTLNTFVHASKSFDGKNIDETTIANKSVIDSISENEASHKTSSSNSNVLVIKF